MKQLFSTLCLLLALAVSNPVIAEQNNTPPPDSETTILFVDINQDSAEKLSDLLIGVGPQKAAAIVQYREANGPFQSIDELINVPGIGTATLEKNREAIQISNI